MKAIWPFALLTLALAAGHSHADGEAPTEAAEAEARPATTPSDMAPDYLDLRRIRPIHGDPVAGKTKAETCSICHGENGVANAPIFANIGGQSADYLYWRLVAFKRGPADSPMSILSANLSPEDMADLSAYYAAMPMAKAADDPETQAPDPLLLARGAQLYLHGSPSQGIPPCQGCHGDDARGHPRARQSDRNGRLPYAAYPALRGQPAPYLQLRLNAFREPLPHRTSNDKVMAGVVAQLDPEGIEALSLWLSSLPL